MTLSADGEHIAFADQIRHGHIWRIELRLDEPRPQPEPVTTGSDYVRSGSVSPDGERLAFVLWGPRQRDLFVSGVDGQQRRQLTDDIHKEWGAQWSRDGKRIAFHCDRSGSYEIWTIDPDGRGLNQVTKVSGTAFQPIWAPDSRRLLYATKTDHFICDANGSGGKGKLVPRFTERVSFSSWSPDGRWLVGTRSVPGILVFSLEDNTYEQLTNLGWGPVWLSDSRRMVFHHKRKIMLLDVESKEQQEIAEIDGYVASLSVTNDDRWIYFVRQKFESDIWLATLK